MLQVRHRDTRQAVGATGFEPATNRPPDVPSARPISCAGVLRWSLVETCVAADLHVKLTFMGALSVSATGAGRGGGEAGATVVGGIAVELPPSHAYTSVHSPAISNAYEIDFSMWRLVSIVVLRTPIQVEIHVRPHNRLVGAHRPRFELRAGVPGHGVENARTQKALKPDGERYGIGHLPVHGDGNWHDALR
jgi:hypothetical protein